jgi:hypothetical protein
MPGYVPPAATIPWPPKNPRIDYRVIWDLSSARTTPIPAGQTISEVTIWVYPCGPHELQAQSLSASGTVIDFIMHGGVWGRLYTIWVEATTFDGETFDWYISLACDLAFAYPTIYPDLYFGNRCAWEAPITVGIYGKSVYGGCLYGPVAGAFGQSTYGGSVYA